MVFLTNVNTKDVLKTIETRIENGELISFLTKTINIKVILKKYSPSKISILTYADLYQSKGRDQLTKNSKEGHL